MYCELHLASVWGENARPVVPGVVYYPRGVVYYPQTDRGTSMMTQGIRALCLVSVDVARTVARGLCARKGHFWSGISSHIV